MSSLSNNDVAHKSPYSKDELYSMGPQKTYQGDATEAAFLLGGIGTGNVSIGARGELKDWEIFNKPGKGNKLPYTFFAIRAKEDGKEAVAKVIESKIRPPFSQPTGFCLAEVAGLPRLEGSAMRGEYPFLRIDFTDEELPVKISLEAYTPFIPLNPEDSGIPCGILNYKVKNEMHSPVDVSVVGTMSNMVGFNVRDELGVMHGNFDGNVNEFRQEADISGIYMYSNQFKEDCIRYGSMCISVPGTNVTVKPNWFGGRWYDRIQYFWDDFCEDGLLESEPLIQTQKNTESRSSVTIGSISIPARLKAGEERVFTFVLSWFFPNRYRLWDENDMVGNDTPIVRNHYSLLYKNAWEVGRYIIRNHQRLERESRKFHEALFSTTLPDYILDAAASNITVLRSPTCFWLEDGSFLGWEGCLYTRGCCAGTCTHVWNYAQTLAFLFPSLERSMRSIEFNKETGEDGKMNFRAMAVLGLPWRNDIPPAADGQMGTIIRLYREWKISGDKDFLKSTWDGAKRALNYAFTYWDSDGDFVLDSQQHNTYDKEFYDPNSLVNSIFYCALKAGAEMAKAMGENELAEKYITAFEKGSKRMDELLWEGEYYIQLIDDVNEYKYQYGKGCLSDQLLGQLLSHIVGLGYIFPEGHVKKAVESIYKYNFQTDFSHHHHVQRTYVMNDEKGLLLCTWPKGGRPSLPFIYSDEVWTGIEYQVAAHLIYEGFVDEGLSLVKAVRESHDGFRRNPWNEVECGYHYARSMASWAVFIALSGFQADMVEGKISFSPKINQDDFSTFWSTGTAWGTYFQKRDKKTGKLEYSINVLYGELGDTRIIACEME